MPNGIVTDKSELPSNFQNIERDLSDANPSADAVDLPENQG